MPLSDDPDKRSRQMANLRRGGPANAGSFKPGDSPRLVRGDKSRSPQRSPEWSPALERAVADLERRLDDGLRNADGSIQAWALPSVEAVALHRVQAWRVERYNAGREARGKLRPADLDTASKIAERYHHALKEEALTLRSRIEARGQARTLAESMAVDAELEDREAALERREADLRRREADADRGPDDG